MRIVPRPGWWYSPDDEPEGDLCEHCNHEQDTGEDDGGECECPRCGGCGEPVTNGENHSRCHLIDDY